MRNVFMGRYPVLYGLLALLLASCVSSRSQQSGPRLVQEITLAATTPAPTRVLSPTPTSAPIVIPVGTSEIISTAPVATANADFVLVTPTLPPSKTPTLTPTMSPTFTPTATPTVRLTATASVFSPSVNPVRGPVVSNPVALNCQVNWFFNQPRPATCPSSAARTSYGSFQQFQFGYMAWIQEHDMVYVLYTSANQPRWQGFQDNYEEGMPEFDPSLNVNVPPYTWQPRRGFGLVWREHPEVRNRVGWAVIEWELPYNVQVQTAPDGTLFFTEPRGSVFSLSPAGYNWERYDNIGGF